MTYPEDVLKAAERVTALFRPVLTFREAERLRDDIAWEIMAERERCAAIAKDEAAFHARRILGMGSGRMWGVLRERDMVCRRIERTILGQQEPAA